MAGRELVNVVKNPRTVLLAAELGNQLGEPHVGGVILMFVHDDGTVEVGGSDRTHDTEQPYLREHIEDIEAAFEAWASRYRRH
jgi:hypothetical protein